MFRVVLPSVHQPAVQVLPVEALTDTNLIAGPVVQLVPHYVSLHELFSRPHVHMPRSICVLCDMLICPNGGHA